MTNPGGASNPIPAPSTTDIYKRTYTASAPVQLQDGTWLLTRYDHVKTALHDPRLSSRIVPAARTSTSTGGRFRQAKRGLVQWVIPPPNYSAEALTRIHGRWLTFMDAPDHTRIRAVIRTPFLARVNTMRPQIQALADELIGQGYSKGTLELKHGLAYPLYTRVIADLMGLPDEAAEQLKHILLYLPMLNGESSPPSREVRDASLEIVNYIERNLAAKRKQRTDDLMSDLITAQENGELSQAELVSSCLTLWLGAVEAPHRLTLLGTDALLRSPGQFARLKQEPALVPNAIEELLRFTSPSVIVKRLALTDIELDGAYLTGGKRHSLSLYAADHDPAEFHDPEHLDITRKPNRQLAFGSGPHICLGAGLARVQAEVVFGTLAQHADRLQYVKGSVPYQIPDKIGVAGELRVRFV